MSGGEEDLRRVADTRSFERKIKPVPDLPGIGFEGKADLYQEMLALSA